MAKIKHYPISQKGCKSISHICCDGVFDLPKNATLEQMVQFYQKHYGPRLKARLDAFNELHYDEALTKATLAQEPLENYKRLAHLRRITQKTLNKASTTLLKQKRKLQNCKDFDAIIEIVSEVVDRIKGLGEMYTYDVALRIAAARNIRPQKVYLQRGVRVGAQNLLGKDKCIGRTLECSIFRGALVGLKPEEIEDFLCIFKEQLRRLNLNR